VMSKLQQKRNRLGGLVRRFGQVSNMAFLLTSFGMPQSGWAGFSELPGVLCRHIDPTKDLGPLSQAVRQKMIVRPREI